jgi:uncharacterized iron-regulated membrane protein
LEVYEGLLATAGVFLIFGAFSGIAARWPHPRAREVMTAQERNRMNKNTETLGSLGFFLFFVSLVLLLAGIWVGVASS